MDPNAYWYLPIGFVISIAALAALSEDPDKRLEPLPPAVALFVVIFGTFLWPIAVGSVLILMFGKGLSALAYRIMNGRWH